MNFAITYFIVNIHQHTMNIIASNLLAMREEKRYTQAYMAIHSNMSQPNYSDIERGKTQPSISQLKKFALILETTVDELIREECDLREKKKLRDFQSQAAIRNPMTPQDKDFYIKLLEDQLRSILNNKEALERPRLQSD